MQHLSQDFSRHGESWQLFRMAFLQKRRMVIAYENRLSQLYILDEWWWVKKVGDADQPKMMCWLCWLGLRHMGGGGCNCPTACSRFPRRCVRARRGTSCAHPGTRTCPPRTALFPSSASPRARSTAQNGSLDLFSFKNRGFHFVNLSNKKLLHLVLQKDMSI